MQRLRSSIVALIKLLQYNFQNLELRIDRGGRSVGSLHSPMTIVNALIGIMEDKSLQVVHRLVAYTLVKLFPLLFAKDKRLCPKVFDLICSCGSHDIIFFATQMLSDQSLLAYCLDPETCERICGPICGRLAKQMSTEMVRDEWICAC